MVLHFRNLLESTNEKQEQATVMFEDNSGAVSLSRSAKITPRTKHIDVNFHHVRSLVADGVVDVTYIKTELRRADILTKNLGLISKRVGGRMEMGDLCRRNELFSLLQNYGSCLFYLIYLSLNREQVLVEDMSSRGH